MGSHMCMHILLITDDLYLLNNGLTGTILTELGLLSTLEHLGLHINQLSGTVLTSLASLPLLSKSQLTVVSVQDTVSSLWVLTCVCMSSSLQRSWASMTMV